VKFWNLLFGGGAEKYEDKADELRLDFDYRGAAFYYRKALEELKEGDEGGERLRRKLREVRREAFDQLLEEAEELAAHDAVRLAQEKLESAVDFADDETAREEVERRMERLAGTATPPTPPAPEPEMVSGTDGDLFELALGDLDPEDQETAKALGESFRLGYEACQREQWEQALAHLETVLADHPAEPLPLELAATAADRLGDKERALGLLQRSQEASPFRPATVQSLVSLYRELDQAAEAKNLLASAVAFRPVGEELPPGWVDIHVDHALVLSEDGYHDEAISKLLSLLELPGVDRGMLFYNLAGALERAGKADDAQAALERAVEASPRRALYKERLADFLMKQGGNLDQALRLLVDANQTETTGGTGLLGGGGSKVTISPNRARYLYKIARIYFLKGEDLEAERTVTTALAVSRDPEVTQALEDLRRELKEVRQSP